MQAPAWGDFEAPCSKADCILGWDLAGKDLSEPVHRPKAGRTAATCPLFVQGLWQGGPGARPCPVLGFTQAAQPEGARCAWSGRLRCSRKGADGPTSV